MIKVKNKGEFLKFYLFFTLLPDFLYIFNPNHLPEREKKKRENIMKKIITAIATGSLVVAASAAVNTELWFSGTEAQVNTGGSFVNVYTGDPATEKTGSTMGYWFDYDDADSKGGSAIIYPLDSNQYGSFIDPMTEAVGYLYVKYNLTDPALTGQAEEYPFNFAGMGFNLVSAKKETMDISSLGGLCVTYTSEHTVTFEIEDDKSGDHSCAAKLDPQATPAPVNVSWSDFSEPKDWGTATWTDCSQAAVNARAIKFKMENGGSPESGILRIFNVGPTGTCKTGTIGTESTTFAYGKSKNINGGSSSAIKAAKAPASVKAALSGRTLSFSGITSGATYEVVSLQGQVVKSGVVSSSVSLSSLNAGIYMLRVSGKAVNMNQKIILK